MGIKKELNVIEQSGKLLVDSRDVATMVEKKHSHLMRDIQGYYDVISENPTLDSQDFFIPSTYKVDNNNKTYDCYLLTKRGCDMVANKMIGEKGILFTAMYVSKFEEMEKELQVSKFKLPTTYKEALLMLIKKEEEKEKLIEENNHKQEVINGLVDDVDIYKKKDVINRVCRKTNHDFANRYNELYKCFTENFHIDLAARCEGYNLKQKKSKDRLTVIRYAEQFGHIHDLYQCCIKLYEADVKKTIDEINSVQC